MARILVSGASGFIGKPLVSFLSSLGHNVVSLHRSLDIISSASIYWDPEKRSARAEDFEGFDAVIHLAGEPLTLSRWSLQKREKILQSRVGGTMFLSHLMAEAVRPPKLFISASAIGYYGSRGDEILTEESASGNGFLAYVCSSWEKASFAIQNRGARVVHARFGMVLDRSGGALQSMLLPFRLGVGGPLGSGEQWISWIHRIDLIRAIVRILDDEFLEGAVNLVAPHPVRQKEFASILAQLMHRPHFFRLPAWFLRLCFGVSADELLLSSTRVRCAKLLESKFSFNYPDLRGALHEALHIEKETL